MLSAPGPDEMIADMLLHRPSRSRAGVNPGWLRLPGLLTHRQPRHGTIFHRKPVLAPAARQEGQPFEKLYVLFILQ